MPVGKVTDLNIIVPIWLPIWLPIFLMLVLLPAIIYFYCFCSTIGSACITSFVLDAKIIFYNFLDALWYACYFMFLLGSRRCMWYISLQLVLLDKLFFYHGGPVLNIPTKDICSSQSFNPISSFISGQFLFKHHLHYCKIHLNRLIVQNFVPCLGSFTFVFVTFFCFWDLSVWARRMHCSKHH